MIGSGGQRPTSQERSTAGGASWRLGPAPGSFYLAIHLLWNEQKNLAHPPQTHVRKKLEPEVPPGNQRAAALALNGQRVGELNESFWTGPRRWIAALESGLRSQVQGHKALARSMDSE